MGVDLELPVEAESRVDEELHVEAMNTVDIALACRSREKSRHSGMSKLPKESM